MYCASPQSIGFDIRGASSKLGIIAGKPKLSSQFFPVIIKFVICFLYELSTPK